MLVLYYINTYIDSDREIVFLCMLISLLWIPTSLEKKIQEINSGTRCHSRFFKEHFLHLISQEALHPNLSSSQIRTKDDVHFYALCFTLFSTVSTLADTSC